MIKIHLTGRLGNQMFQFAFAYLSSKKNKDHILIIPASHFGYCLDIFKLPFVAGSFSRKVFLAFNKMLSLLIPTTKKYTRTSCFYNLEIPEIQGVTEIEGYFQDGRSYVPFRQELMELFRLRNHITDRFKEKYGSLISKRLLVLNVRLGNYKQAYFEEIKHHGLLSKEWYLSALAKVDRADYDHLIVVSDDIEEVRSTFGIDSLDPIYIDDDVATDLQMMMHADCLIISNSSFSWWAAFLNQRPNKRILAPRNWVGYHVGIEYPSGIILEDWEQV